MSADLAGVLRRAAPEVLAKLLPFVGALPAAEDALQDAVERALRRWPRDGVPDAPAAWLLTAARNAHRDHLRRGARVDTPGDPLAQLAEAQPWGVVAPTEPGGVGDDRLALLFACCHPALEPGEAAALALATVLGLSTTEIARAFEVAPRSMEQRLSRARRRLREVGAIDITGPTRDRLPAALRAIHLLYGEGYWSADDDAPIRADLCRFALSLAHALVDAGAARAPGQQRLSGSQRLGGDAAPQGEPRGGRDGVADPQLGDEDPEAWRSWRC